MNDDDPREFVRRVWLDHGRRGYAFAAYFDDTHTFHDTHYPIRPQARPTIKLPNSGVDLYFAPCLFSKPLRRKTHALPGRWLYADLDEADPRELTDLEPTIAWETSPRRYQALWRLTALLNPGKLAALNQKVTYFTRADRGGWSVTKVLRIPGTISHKRDTPFRVHTLWDDGPVYHPRDVLDLVRDVETPSSAIPQLTMDALPKAAPARILRRHRITPRARKLIRAERPDGDRSAKLWELEKLLLKAGLSPEETLVVVRSTCWNKYAGQRRELNQLWTEISKAAAQLTPTPAKPASTNHTELIPDDEEDEAPSFALELVSSAKAQSRTHEPPKWLVDGIWSERGHGVLAGAAKSYKSTLALDLAVSVSTGTRFLNHFDVDATGPVMYIQEENDADWLELIHTYILEARGLAVGGNINGKGQLEVNFSAAPELYFSHHSGFDLRDDDCLRALEDEIQNVEPALIVLDPFYRMARGVDENSAKEVGNVLSPLLDIKTEYGVGILLIHHWAKANAQNPRVAHERISGSGVFGRWFESAVYAERTDENPFKVSLQAEHRKSPPQGKVHVTFDLTEHYHIDVEVPREEGALEFAQLRQLVAAAPGGVSLSVLAQRLEMGTKAVRRKAEEAGFVVERGPHVPGRGGKPPTIVRPADDSDEEED